MFRALFSCFALAFCAACSASSSLSPLQLVGDSQASVAVQEYLIAARRLAYIYDYKFGFVSDAGPAVGPSNRVNRDIFGFPIRADIPYGMALSAHENDLNLIKPIHFETLKDNYIKAGAYASMILCRNYLSGLRDRNEYFEFLQKELAIVGGLGTIAMELAHANTTIRTGVESGLKSLNLGIDAYESFRFLSPEIETIIPIVIEAQIALRDHYLTFGNRPTTFSGAMNAVSQIEYQCTRTGVRGLIDKTLIQSRPQFEVKNGILYAKQVVPNPAPSAAVAQKTK